MVNWSREAAKTQRMMGNKEFYENDLASIIVDCCYHIHVKLGPGLLESVYEEILYQELKNEGMMVEDKNHFQLFGEGNN